MNSDEIPLSCHEKVELSDELSRYILGSEENNGLKLIKSLSGINANARGNSIALEGKSDKINLVKRFLRILQARINSNETITGTDIRRLFRQLSSGDNHSKLDSSNDFPEIITTYSGRPIKVKTANQLRYIEAIEKNAVTIAKGPAGTGKTYLASAMAVKALKEKKVSRLIISRPVVEAGESLGYLPGDLKEKVDPYFRPLYDSLQDFLGINKFEQLIKQGVIEITPLAYMRGRTFNEAFVVLDEAQNTTLPQMRMFLTRLGYGSRMVITGDHTQIDLPKVSDSSLVLLEKILKNVESVAFLELNSEDVIRHEVVRRIIDAFDTFKNKELLKNGK